MIVGLEGRTVHHSVREDFGQLLRAALVGTPVYAAHGPIYTDDPAATLLAPFVRSAREAGIDVDSIPSNAVAPLKFLVMSTAMRRDAIASWAGDWHDVEQWTRAGLVLEVAARRGIPLRDGGIAHVKWKMRGTVTGRFGVEPGGYNPLVIARERSEGRGEHALWRARIVPSHGDREIAVMDFRAMDLSSMISVVPGLVDRYVGADDLHARTAELVGIGRDDAKRELFVHAYGGHSAYAAQLERTLPELNWLRQKPHGEGARLVQQTSATAFRAALSNALPLLVGDDLRPLFTVHDELALDVLRGSSDRLAHVSKALEVGASERIGVPYTVGMKIGRSYAEAKA